MHFIAKSFAFNIVIHQTDIFGINNKPYISISYFDKQQTIYKTESKSLAPEEIAYLNHRTDSPDTKYKLNLQIENIVIRGDLVVSATNIRRDPSLIKTADKANFWQVTIAYGTFSGTIKIEDENIKIRAIVYADHQWGNLLIQDSIKQWLWGHFCNSKTVLILHMVQDSNQNITGGIYNIALGRNKIRHETIPNKVRENMFSLLSDSDLNYSAHIDLSPALSFNLSPNKCFRKRPTEIHDNFSADYFRWLTISEAKNDSEELNGVVDYLNIKRQTHHL